jgi:hypothetical protein
VFNGPDAPLRRLKEAGEIVTMSAAARPVDPDRTGYRGNTSIVRMRHPEGRVSLGELGSVVVRRVRFGRSLCRAAPGDARIGSCLDLCSDGVTKFLATIFSEAPADTADRHDDAAHLSKWWPLTGEPPESERRTEQTVDIATVRRASSQKKPFWAEAHKAVQTWLEMNGFPQPGDGK